MGFKKIIKWGEAGVKKLEWYDISLIKLSTAAFVLLIAKFWPVLVSFNTWIYIVVALLAAYSPMKKFFS